MGGGGCRRTGPPVRRGRAVDAVRGVGHGGQDFFTYQARAFLDEIAGLDRLPRQATFADGLRNMQVEEAIVKSAATGASVKVE